MTPERWHRIERLFQGALDHEGGARTAYLEESCREDEALRREVESLLAAHDRTEGVIDLAAAEEVLGAGVRSESAVAEPSTWIGRSVGPYRIVELIGEGGMGDVFLAERADEEFEDRVAIKVMRPGSGGAAALERFERERQILAGFDHPGIARLRDGGTLPEGLPYFVLDYVDGTPIDVYCDREGLDLHERLELFLEVCDAVQAAHRSLVVHRDVKPANILVTADGRPKLLDFGIAKLLDPEGPADVTRTWHRALTPRYASPEQVSGAPVTTATDVYGLGVLLYELLTGRPPYRLDQGEQAASFMAWQRAVLEQDPEPPSRVAGRHLEGDLDNIVLKALRKDPARRYGSAERLADDIRRHLSDLPVSARPDTLAYRATKFIRRNRLSASLTAALVTLVLAFSAFTAVQAQRVTVERDKAREALSFLTSLFRQTDPLSRAEPDPVRADQITAREILRQGARRVDVELAQRPEIRATLLAVIGEVYSNLGLYDEALPLLETSVELRTRHLGVTHPETLSSLYHLAGVHYQTADYEEAERLYREVLDGRRRALGVGDPATVETMTALALDLKETGDLQGAEELLRRALEIARGPRSADGAQVATLLDRLATVRHRAGDLEEAEALYREALELRQSLPGDSRLELAESFTNLGSFLNETGRLAEAVELYRRANAIWEPVLAPDHPLLLANMTSLGLALKDLGRYDEAENVTRRVLERREIRYRREHPKVLILVNNLATIAADRGDWPETERLYRETLSLARATFGERHRYTAISASSLGFALRELGRLDEAETLQREALELLRELYGDEHPLVTRPILGLGKIALERGDLESAGELVRQAVEARRRLLPPEHPWLREAEQELGAWLTAVGRYEEAEPLLLATARKPDGGALYGSKRRRSLERLVALYRAWGKPAEAERYAEALAEAVSDAAPTRTAGADGVTGPL